MSDPSLSLAIQEAYANAVDEIIYHTLEIRHALISPPIRVVLGHENIFATLESDAPANPGASVEWVAFAFEVQPPDVTTTGVPRMVVEMDNVSRIITESIEKAISSTQPVKICYRAYLDGATGVGPENDPPLEFDIISITATPQRVRLECGFQDIGQIKFPSLTYSTEVFPGLIQ